MKLITCTEEGHAEAILAILNDAIATSTALYDYQPRTMLNMAAWFALKRDHGFPVIGYEDAAGQLLGFASYGSFRTLPAFKYTVEHSIYVEKNSRGLGLGRRLLEAIVAEAGKHGMHTVIGAIDQTNAVSIALHERLGFEHCGTVRQAGFKFGGWLDVAFMQRILDTPLNPVDG